MSPAQDRLALLVVELVVVEQRRQVVAKRCLHRRIAVQVIEQLLQCRRGSSRSGSHAPAAGCGGGRARRRRSSARRRPRSSSVPPSRPVPDALVPPNGWRRSRTFWLLTKHMPASIAGGDAVGAADVLGPDVARQAVGDVVGHARSRRPRRRTGSGRRPGRRSLPARCACGCRRRRTPSAGRSCRRACGAGSVGRVEAAAEQRRAFLRCRARCSRAPSARWPRLIIGADDRLLVERVADA